MRDCNSFLAARTRAKSKEYSLLAWGVATTCVMPSAIALSTMARDSSIVFAPSSIPGRMWQWISIIASPSAPPSSDDLPRPKQEQQRGKHLSHAAGFDAFGNPCAGNASQEKSRDQQNTR